MTTLIEVKARCHDGEAMRQRLGELAAAAAAASAASSATTPSPPPSPPTTLQQDDTFFVCAKGRLKLRELAPDRGRLIFYVRGDGAGAKQTDFVVSKTDAPAALRECLALAYGVLGRVQKTRTVFELGRGVRAHLDQVLGLGCFVELEVVLDGAVVDAARGEALIGEAMAALGIRREDLLSGAYLDLLMAGRAAG